MLKHINAVTTNFNLFLGKRGSSQDKNNKH